MIGAPTRVTAFQPLDDEPHRSGVLLQAGPWALPPVPAPAGDAGIVAPDHLARIHRLEDGCTVADGSKGLTTQSHGQARAAGIGIQVLAASPGYFTPVFDNGEVQVYRVR